MAKTLTPAPRVGRESRVLEGRTRLAGGLVSAPGLAEGLVSAPGLAEGLVSAPRVGRERRPVQEPAVV